MCHTFRYNTDYVRRLSGDDLSSYIVIPPYGVFNHNIDRLLRSRMDPTYKARKEAFVSNLSGGSIPEINLVTLVASVRLCICQLSLLSLI